MPTHEVTMSSGHVYLVYPRAGEDAGKVAESQALHHHGVIDHAVSVREL